MSEPLRIAVIGSGIAGLGVAHHLSPTHHVVLFEADSRLGGHSNTVIVDDPNAGELAVDTGFIVHNDRNYPNLVSLFDELGVQTQPSEMSFSVTDRRHSGARPFTYRATNAATLAADPRNVVDPRMWSMVGDIVRFYRDAREFLADPDSSTTIAEFLDRHQYGSPFVDLHLLPMGSAVWSCAPDEFRSHPAVSLLRFLDHHGLLGLGNRPQWRTVVGGSRRYVRAIAERFAGEIRMGCPVERLERTEAGVLVTTPGGSERFDRVVLAVHSDQALEMLSDASPTEKEVLGAVRYRSNRAVLHTDSSVLPPRRRAWAAWNYERSTDGDMRVTYDLTTLQRLPGAHRYLVTLNDVERIDERAVIAEFDYAHPLFDHAAIEAQTRFEEIDGVDRVHYCGAWWGYGFHEDGLASALRVVGRIRRS